MSSTIFEPHTPFNSVESLSFEHLTRTPDKQVTGLDLDTNLDAIGRVLEEDKYAVPLPGHIFPSLIMNSLREVPILHHPHYADHPVVGFATNGWTRLWNGEPIVLDPFLKQCKHQSSGSQVFWSPEETFQGVKYRLTIRKASRNFPKLTRGQIVTCADWDSTEFRYFIDHCTHRDTSYSYLKVINFNKDHFYHEEHSIRPPFILAVPNEYCSVPMHPNLILKKHRILPMLRSQFDEITRQHHASQSRKAYCKHFDCLTFPFHALHRFIACHRSRT